MSFSVQVKTKGAFKRLNDLDLAVAEIKGTRVTVLCPESGNLIDFTLKEVVSMNFTSKILNHR